MLSARCRRASFFRWRVGVRRASRGRRRARFHRRRPSWRASPREERAVSGLRARAVASLEEGLRTRFAIMAVTRSRVREGFRSEEVEARASEDGGDVPRRSSIAETAAGFRRWPVRFRAGPCGRRCRLVANGPVFRKIDQLVAPLRAPQTDLPRKPPGTCVRPAPLRDSGANGKDPQHPDCGLARERRPLVGIARERETNRDDRAPCQRECRTIS